MKEAEPSSAHVSLDESKILDDAIVDSVPLKELRIAYKELRDRYVDLHAQHHEWIADALAKRKSEGKKTGGDVPYGYRLAPDGETLVADAGEQFVIAEVIRLHEASFSLRGIVRELWKKKLRPRIIPGRRPRPKGRRIGEFDPTQIRRMIEARKVARKALEASTD